jgi:hypothetical protein
MDICVYYITVYKQKIPRGTTPRGTLVGALISSKGNFHFPRKNLYLATSHECHVRDQTRERQLTYT